LVRQTLVEQAGARQAQLNRGGTPSEETAGSAIMGPIRGRAGAHA
jgi:hypothetical protein